MMSSKRVLLFPINLNDLVSDLNAKLSYLEANADRLRIPPSEQADIAAKVAAVNAAKAVTDDRLHRVRGDVPARSRAINAAKTALRYVIRVYVRAAPEATTADHETLHIYMPRTLRQFPIPESAPGIGEIRLRNSFFTARFFNLATGRKAKPEGVQFAQAAFQLDGEPPASVNAMPERQRAATSPMRISFDDDGDYETLYIAFRWVGMRGDAGPWSDIYRVGIAQ
jgi:hypothetical protein